MEFLGRTGTLSLYMVSSSGEKTTKNRDSSGLDRVIEKAIPSSEMVTGDSRKYFELLLETTPALPVLSPAVVSVSSLLLSLLRRSLLLLSTGKSLASSSGLRPGFSLIATPGIVATPEPSVMLKVKAEKSSLQAVNAKANTIMAIRINGRGIHG
jgi:hypothetical protein